MDSQRRTHCVACEEDCDQAPRLPFVLCSQTGQRFRSYCELTREICRQGEAFPVRRAASCAEAAAGGKRWRGYSLNEHTPLAAGALSGDLLPLVEQKHV